MSILFFYDYVLIVGDVESGLADALSFGRIKKSL